MRLFPVGEMVGNVPVAGEQAGVGEDGLPIHDGLSRACPVNISFQSARGRPARGALKTCPQHRARTQKASVTRVVRRMIEG
jgi:hypothetical protein